MSSRLLLHDPQPQIGQLVGLAEGDSLQIDPPVALAAEEPDTAQRRERVRVHSQRRRRWGSPRAASSMTINPVCVCRRLEPE
jgi:hypothetical protein